MGMTEDQRYKSLERRFEQLKRWYFRGTSNGPTTDEVPLYSREQIVQMFENMGVELPMSPNDKMKFRKQPGTPR